MALQYTPENPVPDETVTLSITSASGQTAATRFEITSVPSRSALETGLLVDAAGDPVQTFTPDAPGEYGVMAYDYRRFSGVGAYPGDPAGEARDVLVATQAGTVYVCDTMDLPIRAGGHEVTLRLLVRNTTVADASLVSPTTDKARLAALDGDVIDAVAALEGQAAATLGEQLDADMATFANQFNAHLNDFATVHQVADDVNQLDAAKVASQKGAGERLLELHDAYVQHATTGEDQWHIEFDLGNLPIVPRASDQAGLRVLHADMRRVYASHLADDDVHTNADATNVMPAPALLTAAIIEILDFLASDEPTTPDGENEGAMDLASLFGFRTAG